MVSLSASEEVVVGFKNIIRRIGLRLSLIAVCELLFRLLPRKDIMAVASTTKRWASGATYYEGGHGAFILWVIQLLEIVSCLGIVLLIYNYRSEE